MVKRIMVVMLCLLLVSPAVFAKKKRSSSSSSSVKAATKDMGLGFDVARGMASARFWFSDEMGIDVSAGLNFNSGASSFGFGTALELVVVMHGSKNLNVSLIPGLALGIVSAGGTSVTFVGTVGLECEVPVSKNLSIASVIRGGFGIISAGGTAFELSLMQNTANAVYISPVVVRYYF